MPYDEVTLKAGGKKSILVGAPPAFFFKSRSELWQILNCL